MAPRPAVAGSHYIFVIPLVVVGVHSDLGHRAQLAFIKILYFASKERQLYECCALLRWLIGPVICVRCVVGTDSDVLFAVRVDTI